MSEAPDDEPVLARYQWLGKHRYMVIRRDHRGPWWLLDGDGRVVGEQPGAVRFTHWRPLPLPPEAE